MLIDIIKPDFVFENESGVLKQLVHNGWKQVNVITSYVGSTRGGHYHKNNYECFYVISGSFRLKVWNDNLEENYKFNKGDMFSIPPYVFHIFEYYEETTLISMYSNGVENSNAEKDIWNN